ncbi:galactan 1,3-beta-galactosidase [Fomes fomentarius]|nr:galactan 1,3-beta-galactosidase [Fomes fomentarius]
MLFKILLPVVALAVRAFAQAGVRDGDWSWIVPGGLWLDTDGNPIQAHAGGIVKSRDTWYWIGQDEGTDKDRPLNSGFNLYSSKDLVNWKFLGQPLSPVEGDPNFGPNQVAERPKLIYSPKIQQWVLWWHSDDASYGSLTQSVALSPNITGPFKYYATYKPLGSDSQDFGLFQDDDGAAYALYSTGDKTRDNKITRLNANFTAPETEVYTFNDIDLEAPMIVRTPSSYYIVMSHKTGYRPNNVVAYRAQSLTGPWGQPVPVAPLGTRTFSSQSLLNIRIKGTRQTSYIYVGDSWSGTGSELGESRYLWLPGAIDERKGTFKIDWYDLWAVNVKTGEWKGIAPWQGRVYEAEDGVVAGTAWKQECAVCSGNRIVTGIQGANNTLTIGGIKGTGKPQWVSFWYINPDDMGYGDQPGGSPDRIGSPWKLRRVAAVSVNGGEAVQFRQRDSNKGVLLSAPLKVTFKKGSNNYLTIGGYDGDQAADLDKIVVYDV